MKKSFFRKIFNVFSAFAILSQSLTPYAVLLPQSTYAQEVTPADPTPTVEQSTITNNEIPTTNVTPTPIVDETTPTQDVTPVPTDVPTEITPTPTQDVIPTETQPVDNNSPPSTDSSNSTGLEGTTTTVTPAVESATITPEQEGLTTTENPKDEQLNIIVLENVSAPSIDLGVVESQGSAALLTTDKPDYAPTDTALITGSNLLPNTTYSLRVWSDDAPATSTTVQVTSDENGVFAYAYQLDETYRPNYSAELKDSAGNLVASTAFTDSSQQTEIRACMADAVGPVGSTLNCTAEDISVAQVSDVQILDNGCAFPGDTVTFKATWDVHSQAQSRYDVGLYFATQGQGNAQNGTCSVTTLANTPSPWTDLDGGDACGDINGNTTLHPEITMTVACTDTNGDNKLDVPWCASWDNNQNGTCTGPADAKPGTTAKCKCDIGFQVPITVPSFIEVEKVLSPSDDPGLFNLQINGVTATSGANVGNGGTTGPNAVSNGTNTLGETQGTGTSLSNYSSTVVCKDGHGTGNTITTTGTNPWSLNVVAGKDILCTITNTRVNNASITIVKDAVPNDAQDFAFTTTGTGLSSFNLDDDSDGTLSNTKIFNGLGSGTYSVAEDAVTGWTLSNITCTDPTQNSTSGLPAAPTATINLAAGENVTCTFTNTKRGHIIVNKVTDPSQDTQSFDFTTTGAGYLGFSLTDQATPNDQELLPGTYSVAETPITGWDLTGATCDNQDDPSSITLSAGQTVTCTFTNSRLPTLTLIKTVTNDNGGTATSANFQAKINGNNVPWSVAQTLTPTAYTASETTLNTYTPSDWGTDCNAAGSVTLAYGDNKICTITNDDKAPILHLRKLLTNDNGGSKTLADFTLYANGLGSNDLSGTSPVDSGGSLKADSFTLSETNVTGYDRSAWNCVGGTQNTGSSIVTLGIGEEATCTISNNDRAAHLIVIKHVINDNGGTAAAADFSTTISGVTTAVPTAAGVESPGVNNVLTTVGSYSVDEGTHTGYDKTLSTDCSGTIALGETKTCTITNDDNAPSLTLVKVVVNDNGGTATEDQWTLTATGPSGFSGAGPSVGNGASFDAGTYDLSESGLSDYTASDWVCVGGNQTDGATVVIGLGESVTCTITNDDNTPALHLKKTITNDNGGNALATAWTLTATGTGGNPTNLSGTTPVDSDSSFKADTYALAEINGPSGYTAGAWDCGRATMPDATHVTVLLGGDITCTINNDDIAPTLNLVKDVTNDNGGNAVAGNWDLTARRLCVAGDTDPTCGFTDSGDSIAFHTVRAGRSYVLSESGPGGYTAGSWSCDGGTLNGNKLTLGLNENVTCTITNDDQPGHLIVHKVTNPADDSTVFSVTLDATPVNGDATRDLSTTTDVNYEVNAGTYSVTEASQTGWDETGNTCENVVIANGDTEECIITNTQRGSITVTKYTDPWYSNQKFDFTLTGTGTGSANLGNNEFNTFDNLLPGSYSLSETPISGWDLSYTYCYDENDDTIDPTNITLNPGGNISCEFDNTQRGKVIVTKYNDPEGEGKFNPDGQVLSGWTIRLDSLVATTSANGTVEFDNLLPGNYFLNEDLKNGWEKTNLFCDQEIINGEGFLELALVLKNVFLDPGQTVNCYILNHNLTPILTISKSNNASGNKAPGDNVGFTITISADSEGGPADNVKVTDLLPKGFVFNSSSWKVVSSDTTRGVSGDITSLLTAPTYASPGTWSLGYMNSGETLTLTYTATIDGNQATGTYYDNAWGQGNPVDSTNIIFARAINPGDLDAADPSEFVGTEVSIVNGDQGGVDYKATLTKEVLGASTYLPATGENTLWVIIATLLMGLGLGVTFAGYKLRKKYE